MCETTNIAEGPYFYNLITGWDPFFFNSSPFFPPPEKICIQTSTFFVLSISVAVHDNLQSTFCFRKWTCRSEKCCSSVEAGPGFGQDCILSTENIMKLAASVSYYSLVAENMFHRCSHQLWCIINLSLALLYKLLWKILKHGAPVAVVYSVSWRFLWNGLLFIITGSSSHFIWSKSCETASVMASCDC